jgi:hypothetical protein
MKGGTQAAVALGIGYLLGRRRRLRRAAILAAVTATGSFGGLSKALMSRGLKAVGSTEMLGQLTPELGEIADTARTELLDAGKTAAMALVTNRVESLSDSLRSRADVLRDPAAAGLGVADVLRGGGGGRRGDGAEQGDGRGDYRSGRDGRDEDTDDDEYETDQSGYQDEDTYHEDYGPDGQDEIDGEYERDDEGPDEETASAPRRRARVTSSPVSRAGR